MFPEKNRWDNQSQSRNLPQPAFDRGAFLTGLNQTAHEAHTPQLQSHLHERAMQRDGFARFMRVLRRDQLNTFGMAAGQARQAIEGFWTTLAGLPDCDSAVMVGDAVFDQGVLRDLTAIQEYSAQVVSLEIDSRESRRSLNQSLIEDLPELTEVGPLLQVVVDDDGAACQNHLSERMLAQYPDLESSEIERLVRAIGGVLTFSRWEGSGSAFLAEIVQAMPRLDDQPKSRKSAGWFQKRMVTALAVVSLAVTGCAGASTGADQLPVQSPASVVSSPEGTDGQAVQGIVEDDKPRISNIQRLNQDPMYARTDPETGEEEVYLDPTVLGFLSHLYETSLAGDLVDLQVYIASQRTINAAVKNYNDNNPDKIGWTFTDPTTTDETIYIFVANLPAMARVFGAFTKSLGLAVEAGAFGAEAGVTAMTVYLPMAQLAVLNAAEAPCNQTKALLCTSSPLAMASDICQGSMAINATSTSCLASWYSVDRNGRIRGSDQEPQPTPTRPPSDWELIQEMDSKGPQDLYEYLRQKGYYNEGTKAVMIPQDENALAGLSREERVQLNRTLELLTSQYTGDFDISLAYDENWVEYVKVVPK